MNHSWLDKLNSKLSFIIGALVCLWFFGINIVGTSLEYFPGDLGDARFNIYILEHAHRFFCGQDISFWNASFMYPEKNVITYSDNLLGTAFLYSLFRLGGLDSLTSFQYWFLVMVVLNYTSCYYLLRFIFKNYFAAVLGAIVYASSICLQSQIGHAQTIPRFTLPLAIWMGLLFFRELKPKFFFLMLLFMVYQIYCGIYLGFMSAVPLCLTLIISLILQRKVLFIQLKNKKWLLEMAVSVIVNLLVLLPLILPYWERSKDTGLNDYENVLVTVPTFKCYFYCNPGSLFWGFLEHVADEYFWFWNYKIFCGGVATLSILSFFLYGIIRILKRDLVNVKNSYVPVLLFLSFFTFLFFLKVNDSSLYYFIYKLPGFGSLRALQRVINVELISYAIAVAFISSVLLKEVNTIKSLMLFVMLTTLIIADNWVNPVSIHRTKKEIAQVRVLDLINKMKNIPKGYIVSYEPDSLKSNPIDYQIDAMLACQNLNLKCINGYTATSPKNYFYWDKLNKESRDIWVNYRELPKDSIYVVN